MTLIKSKYNKSKTYILPLISEVINIDSRFINSLENTYLLDGNNKFENCIFLEFEPNFRDPEFTKYEHELTSNDYFIKHIDIGNKVIYIFRFPEEYLNEYDYFLRSKYSRFGEDAKALILKFWTTMYGKSTQGVNAILKIKQILYKDKKLKQQIEECLSSIDSKVILSDDAELGELVLVEDEAFKLIVEEFGDERGNANEKDIDEFRVR